MEYIVTQNELLNIDNTIITNAGTFKGSNTLLEEYVYNRYDVLEEKSKLLKLFSDFKSARYLYDFPVETNMTITPLYEEKVGSAQRKIVSQVENAIERYVDKQLLTTEIYNSIIKVSFKLTGDEVIYLINTFLVHKSEEDIAYIIGISKTHLQKIKKSCIVKMWVELEKYCEKYN